MTFTTIAISAPNPASAGSPVEVWADHNCPITYQVTDTDYERTQVDGDTAQLVVDGTGDQFEIEAGTLSSQKVIKGTWWEVEEDDIERFYYVRAAIWNVNEDTQVALDE